MKKIKRNQKIITKKQGANNKISKKYSAKKVRN